MSTYNAQVKQFNESLARFNEEKNEFQLLKQKLETEKQEAEKRQAELEETKAELERQKTEAEKSRLENDKKHLESLAEFQEKSAALDRQTTELKERELDLESRENALNAARREFNSRRYAAGYAAPADQFYTSPAPYTAAAAGYAEGGRNGPLSQTPVQSAPFAEKQEQRIDFGDLHERARTDGIQIKTAGSMGGKPKAAGDNFAPVFNKGLTLFKAALIAFCIVIAESLAVFFRKGQNRRFGALSRNRLRRGISGFSRVYDHVCLRLSPPGPQEQASRLYPQRLYPICHRRHRGNDDRRISQGRSQAARGAAQVCASARRLPSQPRFLCGILLFIFSKFEKLCRRKRINVLSIIKSPCASRLQESFLFVCSNFL